MPSLPGLLHRANESIAHSTLPQVTTSVATCQSHHLAQWAAAQAAVSSVTNELGK
jgi:predicted component of type VI protein secretion system